MVLRFIRFGVKAGLSAAFVEYTIEQGVWGSADDTAKLYAEVYKNVAPYVKEVPVEVPELPSLSDITYSSQYYWNTGVKKSINFIQNVPSYTVESCKKGWELMLQFAESPKATDN